MPMSNNYAMEPAPEMQRLRPRQTPSVSSVSTIRGDPFSNQGQVGSHAGLFHGQASSSQMPPVPPARTSSLLPMLPGSPLNHLPLNPGSPSSRRVPALQVIHPTPTKKKGRPRSTASGDTAIAASPTRRPMSAASSQDAMAADEPMDDDREEAKKARAREKGRERQRRKRERDKAVKQATKHLTASTTSLTSMSVPSSVSSTYSSLPHTQSLYSLSASPNQSFAFSTSSTSLSGQSSTNVLLTPAVAPDAIYTGKIKSRRNSPAPPIPHTVTDDHVSKRRKSEPEPDDFRLGLGVSLPFTQDGNSTIRGRPRPHRTASFAPTEVSTCTSAAEPDSSDWGARSPTPPPVPRPARAEVVTRQGQFFASTLILACEMSGLAASLEASLKLGKKELDGMKEELGAVYDRWAKKVMEQDMGKVSLDEPIETDQATSTPQRPRADTLSGPPGPPPQAAHGRTRSVSSASMLARGLVLNPIPGPPSHPQPKNTWESKVQGQGPGSDSPTNSNLQTPSTGQGTSFIIPNHDPVPTVNMPQGQGHWRNLTEPITGYDYQMEWKAGTGGLESPLTVVKPSRPSTAGPAVTAGAAKPTVSPTDSSTTPPRLQPLGPPAVPQSQPAAATPTAMASHPVQYQYRNFVPAPNDARMYHTMPQQPMYYPPPHAYPPQNYTPGPSPYPTGPWTPTPTSRPAAFRHGMVLTHPFTPGTPMTLMGGNDTPMYYNPAILAQQTATLATPDGTPQGTPHHNMVGLPPLPMPQNAVIEQVGEGTGSGGVMGHNGGREGMVVGGDMGGGASGPPMANGPMRTGDDGLAIGAKMFGFGYNYSA